MAGCEEVSEVSIRRLKQRFLRGLVGGGDSGASGEVTAGADIEKWDLGPLLGSLGRVLWGSKAKFILVNSEQKASEGSYIRGTQRRPWSGGGDFI